MNLSKKAIAMETLIIALILGFIFLVLVIFFSTKSIDTSKSGITLITKNSLTENLKETEKFICSELEFDGCLKKNEGLVTCFYGKGFDKKVQKEIGCYLCDPE